MNGAKNPFWRIIGKPSSSLEILVSDFLDFARCISDPSWGLRNRHKVSRTPSEASRGGVKSILFHRARNAAMETSGDHLLSPLCDFIISIIWHLLI